MNKITIKLTERDLRWLNWRKDRQPQTYHVARCDNNGMISSFGGRLTVAPDCDCAPHYGAYAFVSGYGYGCKLRIFADKTGTVSATFSGRDVEIVDPLTGERITDRGVYDWESITGFKFRADKAEDFLNKERAVIDCIDDLYSRGGRVYRAMDYSDEDGHLLFVCPDGRRVEYEPLAVIENRLNAGFVLGRALVNPAISAKCRVLIAD